MTVALLSLALVLAWLLRLQLSLNRLARFLKALMLSGSANPRLSLRCTTHQDHCYLDAPFVVQCTLTVLLPATV